MSVEICQATETQTTQIDTCRLFEGQMNFLIAALLLM